MSGNKMGTHPPIRQATRPTLLVSDLRCEKSHTRGTDCSYRVAWAINPHMKIGAANWRLACAQHRRYVNALRRVGAEVRTLPFVHGAFDSVFAKDNALLIERKKRRLALLSRFVHPERQPEQRERARVLDSLGFEVFTAPSAALEGGDIAVLPRGKGALLGVGQRSNARAAAMLEVFLDAPVTTLELVSPKLYHLDTALCILSDGTALVAEEAFTRRSFRALEQVDGVKRILTVPVKEALGFGLNLVEVGHSVLMGGRAPYVAKLLRILGFEPVVAPLDQFHLAGGSASCLVARVYPVERLAVTATTATRSTSA